MPIEDFSVTIRDYAPGDRDSIRRINYETSFLHQPHLFFDDPEIVTDALTRYYIDFEPRACFVAEFQGRVVGYVIGTANMERMNRIYFFKIFLPLVVKAIKHKVFFQRKTMLFIFNCMKSFLMGEFQHPNFTKEYPSTFHINVDEHCRGQKVGSKLIQRTLQFLRDNKIKGVQFSTMTDESRNFFMRQGFQILYSSRRTFLRYALGRSTPFHLLGMKIN